MKFFLGALPHNQHLQNIAQALYESGRLAGYWTAGVDQYQSFSMRTARKVVARAWPDLNTRFARRKVRTIPENLVYGSWKWEGLRTLAHVFRMNECVEDWLWERAEYDFDRQCTATLKRRHLGGFVGVEHGCLESLRASKELGMKSIVGFLSPHHSVLQETVFSEYEKFPELVTPYVKRLLRLAPARNARKDAEATVADCIHTASEFTAQSLVRAGFPRKKMTVVPLGSPPVVCNKALPRSAASTTRFAYAGPFSVRKGAHYLLNAWKDLAPGSSAELHVYGTPLLPDRCLTGNASNVTFHGPVSQSELATAYQQSSALIFPTLCDGFGMVAMEAFAHGLPVVMTNNAGAADLIDSGQNGFLVPAKNVNALTERMEWCIQHPSELLAMRRYALATAESWTWARFRDSFLKQTADVLGMCWESRN